jgi:hypothetical protein
MPKYRTHFELGLEDIDRIEVSLTKRVGDLTRRVLTDDSPESREVLDEIQDLRRLLGKIHEQKIWYQPSEFHPSG